MTREEIEQIAEQERKCIFTAKAFPNGLDREITRLHNMTKRFLNAKYEGREYNTGSGARELKLTA